LLIKPRQTVLPFQKTPQPLPEGALDRTRSFYLAPDISFSRIPTKKRWVKSLLFLADMIKCPAPTVEYTNQGKWKFKPFFM